VSGRQQRAHTGGELIFVALDPPARSVCDLIAEYATILPGACGGEFIAVNVYLTTGNIAEAARMIEMQMAQKDHIDIFDAKSQPVQVVRNALFLGHLRWLKQRPHRLEETPTQLGVSDFAVVAPDVIENPSVRCLDQKGQDRRIDVYALPAVTRRDDLLVTLCAGQ